MSVHPLRWPRLARNAIEQSLLVRLSSSFVGLAIVIVSLTATATYLRARAALRDQILDRLRTVAFLKEGELNRWVDEKRLDLVYVSKLPGMRLAARRATRDSADTTASRELHERLDTLRMLAHDLDEVFLVSAIGGRVVASTDRARIGDYRVNDLFVTKGRNQTYVENVYLSPTTGRPTLTISTPIRDGDSTVAILATHLNLARIDEILAERTGLGATGEAYLVTPLNDVVSSRRFGRADSRRGVHSLGVQAALTHAAGSAVYPNYAGIPVLGAWRWNEDRQLALMVELHADEAFAPASDMVRTILMFGIGSALLMAIGIWILARRITEPVLAVARTAREVAAGNFSATAPVVTKDEVGVLARAFNDMTLRLRGVYGDLNRQVDETYRAYRALEESQQLLQAVVDNDANLVVVLDASGKLLLVNRRFEDLLKVRLANVRGLEPGTVLPPEAAGPFEEVARGALLAQRSFELEADLTVDGVLHHYHLIGFPLAQGGHVPFGVGIVGVDLSERTRAEEERRKLEAGVQQAQKLEGLGLLAGGVAHDFNNILTAIIGGTALALEELPDGSPVREDLQQVITAAERAAKLTRQMLAYAGRASLAIETFDLNSVIREMAELIAISVPKQVTLRHELEPGALPMRGDRTQISQIVLNLITNAAEAISEAGGQVVARTGLLPRGALVLADYRFVPADAPSYVLLSVQDTGAGMTDDTMARMFDPFFSTKGSGRGLGLAAVLGIVRQSGGTMRVSSAPGRGTTVTVLFPAAERAAVAPAPPARPEPPKARAGLVMLVDDEDVVRRATRRVLEKEGFTVIEAVNGQEAVDRFTERRGDLTLIILDVTMPVMGGAEAFQRMREIGPAVPVLVSSGYDQSDTIASFHGDDVAFLQKPYKPDSLMRRVRETLAGAARAG